MFTVYSKPGCGFCDKAKSLLESKSLPYSEIILDVGQEKISGKEYVSVDELKRLVPGVRAVPQIFKDGQHLGGYEALKASIV